jgi:metallophosphoesterase superfamily enzyme
VKAGATAGGKTEIFGDLKDGDQVVVPASDELAPGTPVVAHMAKSQ